ncbi:MAG: hypothetical protein ACOCXG_03530 [Nanoarchaeota archaeon]
MNKNKIGLNELIINKNIFFAIGINLLAFIYFISSRDVCNNAGMAIGCGVGVALIMFLILYGLSFVHLIFLDGYKRKIIWAICDTIFMILLFAFGFFHDFSRFLKYFSLFDIFEIVGALCYYIGSIVVLSAVAYGLRKFFGKE